jgi:hypothetical protein
MQVNYFLVLRDIDLASRFCVSEAKRQASQKEGLSESEKALSFGFAIPILLTAAAIIFGLVVYDITRTDLQVWVWVVMQVIVVNPNPFGVGFTFRFGVGKGPCPFFS